jgi:transposase-like protein
MTSPLSSALTTTGPFVTPNVPSRVSVRRVGDITEAPWGTRVSSGTVSRLNQKIYRHIEAWRNREIVGF